MFNIKNFIKKEKLNTYKLLLDSVIVGFFAGIFAILYRFLISKMDFIRKIIYSNGNLQNIIFLLILFFIISIVINALLKYSPLSGGSGIPQIRAEILGKFNMKEKRIILSKLIGGSLASLVGLSTGREGPSIQIGGALGKLIAKILKRDTNYMNYLIIAGAGAGLAAAFNAPIAGTVFVIEELNKSISKFILIPTLIASLIANYISFIILGQNTSFNFIKISPIPMNLIWICICIGIFTGVLGVIFNIGLIYTQKIYKNIKLKNEIKFFIMLILAIIIGFNFYNVTGGGHGLIENLANNKIPFKIILLFLILKLIYTWISYGSGVQGGIFLPTLCIGALIATLLFTILNNFIDLDKYYINFIILGMSGILASVVRSPILSIILITEMTGSITHLLPLGIVVIISYIVADFFENPPIYDSLFENQLKLFDKKI